MWRHLERVLLVLSLVASLGCLQGEAGITINKGGGYGGIVIAIHEEITFNTVDDERKLINKLKSDFGGTSSAFEPATGYRFFINDITILIPGNWNISRDANYSPIEESTSITYDEASVRVATENPVFGVAPYVKRNGTCGHPGLYMHLTREFINLNETERLERFGSVQNVLLHELGHLLWGVYEEYPRPTLDDQHYLNESGHPQPNTCSDITGSFRNKTDHECDPRKDSENCYFIPDRSQTVDSSLMGYSRTTITKFCEADDDVGNGVKASRHVSEAPTEQNLRCDGRSVMGTVRDLLPDHWALRHNGTAWPIKGPCPEGTWEARTSVCFRVLKAKRQSTFTFIWLNEKQSNKDNETQTVVPPTIIMKTIIDTFKEGEALVQLFISSTGQFLNITSVEELQGENAQDHPCNDQSNGQGAGSGMSNAGVKGELTCILRGYVNEGAHVYIFFDKPANGGGSDSSKIDSIITMKELVLHCIFLKRNQPVGRWLPCRSEAVTRKGQKEVRIGSGKKTKTMKMYQQKVKAKQEIVGDFFVEKGQHQYVKLSLVNDTGNITVTFEQDKKQESESCQPQQSLDSLECTVSVPENLTAGKTTFNVSLPSPADVDLEIEGTPKEGVEPIVAFAVLRTPTSMNFSDPSVPQLIVSAEVTQGFLFVLNASVTATALFLDGNGTEIANLTATFPLLDNGVGADDRENDGLYSAYFTDFPTDADHGIEGLSIEIAVDNNDGAAVVLKPKPREKGNTGSGATESGALDMTILYDPAPLPDATFTDPFLRLVPEVNYDIIDLPADGQDLYPPAKVRDLHVSNILHEERRAVVSFTATGDDLMQDMATRFRIHHNESQADLRLNFSASAEITQDQIIDGALKQPGELVNIVVDFTGSSQLRYALGVIIEDDSGHESEPSNVAVFQFSTPEPAPSPTTTAAKVLSTSPGVAGKTTTVTSTPFPTDFASKIDNRDGMWLILKICLPILGSALLAGLVLLICCCCRKCRKRKQTRAKYPNEPVYDFPQTPSEYNNNDNSHLSPPNTMSPGVGDEVGRQHETGRQITRGLDPHNPFAASGKYEKQLPSAQTELAVMNSQQGFPTGGFSQQGFPTGGFSQQGFPAGGFPQQEYPTGGFPRQDYPTGGLSQQGFPAGGNPQEYPTGGFPPQEYPTGGFPQQGFPTSGSPRQDSVLPPMVPPKAKDYTDRSKLLPEKSPATHVHHDPFAKTNPSRGYGPASANAKAGPKKAPKVAPKPSKGLPPLQEETTMNTMIPSSGFPHHVSTEDIAKRDTACMEYTDALFSNVLPEDNAMPATGMDSRVSGIYHDALISPPSGNTWQACSSAGTTMTTDVPATSSHCKAPNAPQLTTHQDLLRDKPDSTPNPFGHSSFYDQIGADDSFPQFHAPTNDAVKPDMFKKGFSYLPNGGPRPFRERKY